MRNAEEAAAISLLLGPLRWRLYEYIRASGCAAGRDEAAQVGDGLALAGGFSYP